MKFIFALLGLLSLSLCEAPPKGKLIAVEDAFVGIKKNILTCLSKEEGASAELKKYVEEQLASDLKESLNLYKFRENESDRDIIRKCRREAFIHNTARDPIRPTRFLPKKRN